ncbi:hypothetical protein Tco_1051265 [Tanacetum coccineum]
MDSGTMSRRVGRERGGKERERERERKRAGEREREGRSEGERRGWGRGRGRENGRGREREKEKEREGGDGIDVLRTFRVSPLNESMLQKETRLDVVGTSGCSYEVLHSFPVESIEQGNEW